MKETSYRFTPEGIEKLHEEVLQLKERRQEATTQQRGEEVSFLDGRIRDVERLTAQAVIFDGQGPADASIQTGAWVTLRDIQFDRDMTYRLVNRFEADPLANKMSGSAPLGAALMTKKAGERVRVESHGNTLEYEILTVEYGNT